MQKPEITEEMILDCFAAATPCEDSRKTAESFIDVEMYEKSLGHNINLLSGILMMVFGAFMLLTSTLVKKKKTKG